MFDKFGLESRDQPLEVIAGEVPQRDDWDLSDHAVGVVVGKLIGERNVDAANFD